MPTRKTHIHHILAQADPLCVDPVVAFLQFDVHSFKNLIELPADRGLANALNASPHTGGHLGSYCEGFSEFLSELRISQTFADAEAGDTAARDQVSADLDSFLATAKFALANGHLLANTPNGMTPEQANMQNQKWFAAWRQYAAENRIAIQQMEDTVRQLYEAGSPEKAWLWPILSPTGNLSLADRIDLLQRYGRDVPISQQFTVVGPVPGLSGLVPPVVDTRLPGFVPPPLKALTQMEGFTPTPNPLLTYGLPGFPVIDPSSQGLGRLPPSTATPQDPLNLKFDPATGWPLPFFQHSPILEPDPPSSAGSLPTEVSILGGLMALGLTVPELLPALAPRLIGTAGLVGAAASVPAWAASVPNSPASSGGGIFSMGATPYNAFSNGQPSLNANSGNYSEATSALPKTHSKPINQTSALANPFADRFGNRTETSAGTMPAQSSGVIGDPAPDEAQAVAPENVRRLTRVNASNAANVFTSGAAPVPYLPSSELDDRLGNWRSSPDDGRSQPASGPVGGFAGEPTYSVAPPIWGFEGPSRAGNGAEEWFSRWIEPLMRRH